MEIIDGSFGEGGGQILRTAIAISALSGKPIKVINIRSKRENPGLRPQHLLAVKALAMLCNAKVEGASISSRELTFIPSKIKGGNYTFDVGTAGSVTLVLQALLPVLVFAQNDSYITIKGGTSVPKSPTINYFEDVLLFHLKKMGVNVKITLIRHGFYPKGGGVVNVEVKSIDELKPLNLEKFGEIKKLKLYAYSEGLPCHIVEREIDKSLSLISEKVAKEVIEIEKQCINPSSSNIGNFFFISALGSKDTVLGYDGIGQKGLPAEKVAEKPTLEMIQNIFVSNAAVDMFAGDQLLIWMALAKGVSIITTHKYTMHAYTTLHLLKQLLDIDFQVEGSLDKFARIKIYGKSLK
ncbi:MAG: RNA 3'-terminal phosphate cyclase [Thermoproteota archaeon]|jgi:RNA 3'-phosphate cyclase|nr:RNA 3'-terminal phosphate cyclase [Thermoproteota archaeon]